MLYRAKDRHPQDERLLVIQDMDDFALWRERNKLQIGGMVWKYPASLQALEDMIKPLKNHSKQEIQCAYSGHTSQFRDQLKENYIPEPVIQTARNLCHIYSGACQLNSPLQIQLRINSQRTINLHPDYDPRGTLSFAFTQGGTVIQSLSGQEFQIDTGNLLLLSEHILHKTPLRTDDWDNVPRVNVVT